MKNVMKAAERAAEAAKAYEGRGVGKTVVKVGDVIEVKIEGAWWQGEITGCGRMGVRAAMFSGAPASDAVLSGSVYGTEWRLSKLAVHHVPLTSQGVRNLNLAAPKRYRNGNAWRRPAMWMAVCPHPEEMIDEDNLIEEEVLREGVRLGHGNDYLNWEGRLIDRSDAIAFRLFYVTCLDCGAELPA